ncbi:MAG TPA: hypothetical protein VFZ54_06050 [Burkholderiales bacterium]
MKTTLVSVSIALALGTLAACDRNPNPTQGPATTPPSSTAPSSTAPSSTAGTGSSAATPSTPANAGADKKDGGQPPVQGQVDAKQAPQQKDFQQKGDGAGPKPGG